MSGTVLYRKWRPADFDEVVGQDAVVQTLKNAVAQDKIAHAYLFCGPRGTGKTTTARILARAINGRTASSGASALGQSDDLGFDLVEIDAASNRGIDDIRGLRERANYRPGSARFKVYLIDEVHQLTGPAADALLKTLEEPPPHVVFVLATTDPEALTPTILSRCQRFDFRRVGVDDMVSRLRTIAESEQIVIPDEALRLIAREATGSLRDGVNLLDQVWVMCGDSVSLALAQEALGLSPDARALELASAAMRRQLPEGLAVLSAVQEDAIDFGRFKRQVVTHLRHALLTLTGATGSLSLSAPEVEQLQAICQGVDAGAAVSALRAFSEADVRRDPYQPLPLELALASLVYEPQAVERVREQAPPTRQQRSERSDGQRRRGSQRRGQQPTQQRSQSNGTSQAPSSRSSQRPPAPTSQPQPQSTAARQGSSSGSGRGSGDLLNQIRDMLRQRDLGLIAAMLNGSCQIVDQQQDTITLGFLPSFQQVHMQKVIEASEAVSAAASQVLKRRVSVKCVPSDGTANTASSPVANSSASGGTSPRAKPSAPAANSVIRREAESRFGAKPFQPNSGGQ